MRRKPSAITLCYAALLLLPRPAPAQCSLEPSQGRLRSETSMWGADAFQGMPSAYPPPRIVAGSSLELRLPRSARRNRPLRLRVWGRIRETLVTPLRTLRDGSQIVQVELVTDSYIPPEIVTSDSLSGLDEPEFYQGTCPQGYCAP